MDHLNTLTAALERMDHLRKDKGDTLNERRPEMSGWSAAQHLYHVALATDLALSCVATILAGTSPRVRQDLPKSELFAQLLARGSFPRGTQAPRLVIPPTTINLDFLEQELATASAAAAKFQGQNLSQATGRIMHEILGGLDAKEWLAFAQMHVTHHLNIAEGLAS